LNVQAPKVTADINNDGYSDIIWLNPTSGVVSAWLLNGSSVTGTQTLSWTCSISSGCLGPWQMVGAADVNGDGHTDLTWYNETTGEVSSWLLNGSGTVTGSQSLTWTCDPASGCASAWHPVGFVSFP
jgi:hypothetical protein